MSGILSAFVGGTYSSAPVNSVAPAVTGTATFGQTLSSTTGTWTGVPTPTFAYQWFRSPSTSIGGATSSTYVLVAADVGNTIFCRVTATNTIGAVDADSNTTATVAAAVPDAPTIGTATASGPTGATVSYTAPANNGGSVITSYTATSSPGGITGTLSQAGSGTITVSGLTTDTAYTFTVTATNVAGTSAPSAASNSVTPIIVVGQDAFTTPGTYTWVCPAGVTKISVVCVGGGAGGAKLINGSFGGSGNSSAGGGGALGYINNYTVIPGNSYTVRVGAGGAGATSFNTNGQAGGDSYFISTATMNAGGAAAATSYNDFANKGVYTAGTSGTAGYNGGIGSVGIYRTNGGASSAGYAAAGVQNGSAGAGGSGGAGGYRYISGGTPTGSPPGSGETYFGGAGGGGIGILGQGADGGAAAYGFNATNTYGRGGSGGDDAANPSDSVQGPGGNGANYGAGGASGSSTMYYTCCYGIQNYANAQNGGAGAGGAVRIIYPGDTRSFPSTNTGNL